MNEPNDSSESYVGHLEHPPAPDGCSESKQRERRDDREGRL